MNDEPIFTKCGRELYEKKCVFWVTGGTSQKKHPVYLNIKKDNRTSTDATIASQKKYTNSLLHGRWSYHYYIRQVVQQKIQGGFFNFSPLNLAKSQA